MTNQPESELIIVAAVRHCNPYPVATHSKAHTLFCYGAKKFIEHKAHPETAPKNYLSCYPSHHPTYRGYVWCSRWEADPNAPMKQKCESCKTELFIVGGMAGTGLCGPCCTGESETLDEAGKTW